MLGKLAVLLLVSIVVVQSKQCNEKKAVNLVSTKNEQLTGRALVEHINKLGIWKVSIDGYNFTRYTFRPATTRTLCAPSSMTLSVWPV
jgi:hypothetical protein